HKLSPTPVKVAARELGLRVFEPLELRSFAGELSSEPLDLFCLASYGKILPQALLDLPRLGALNVHPSLLPKYRGATPIQTALRNGDTSTGVSVMLMDSGMDTGGIVLQEPLEILPSDDYETLHDRLAFYGGDLLGQAIDLAERGELRSVPQVGEPSITRPLKNDDLAIDWAWPAQRIVNAVRALAPKPGARGELEGETVKILRAHVGDDDRVVIDELIAPNRGRMSGESFSRLKASLRQTQTSETT
ncbi:MAG: methionyl-tRNA formyltransferase, partial [Candidatus Eremiobacteraeota bacterium]|nr:methionyl-tRNA formyltransferase [Candidatus Eremiobacteraeota bacterium]